MIHDLTSTLTRLEQYLDLFPGSQALTTCIHCLIDEYVGFCVSAYKFFIRWPPIRPYPPFSLVTKVLMIIDVDYLLRMLWSTVDYKFKKAKQNINKHILEFDRTCQLVVDTELVQGQRQIQATLAHPPAIIHVEPETFYDVPYTQNHFFCGRDETLILLHQYLTGIQDLKMTQRTSVIHGIGGIGKTQVAIEYTFRYRSSYDFIFWIRAETKPELLDGVERISHSLNLTSDANAIDSFRKWLEKTSELCSALVIYLQNLLTPSPQTEKRWLLVFDNAQDWATVNTCWPRSTNGSVILTAQNPEFAQVAKLEIALKPFSHADGATLLLKHLREENTSEQETAHAKSICDELGGLPLAIAHVAGYLTQSKTPLREFLEQFSERVNSAQLFRMSAPMTTFQYEKTLGVVWDVALQRLSSDALQLIQILAMMNPDGVPEDMLYGDHQAPSLEFLRAPDKMRCVLAARSMFSSNC